MATGAGSVTVGPQLDLTEQQSVRAFAKSFMTRHDRLDVLVNNAGINFSSEWRLGDGTVGMVAVRLLCFAMPV